MNQSRKDTHQTTDISARPGAARHRAAQLGSGRLRLALVGSGQRSGDTTAILDLAFSRAGFLSDSLSPSLAMVQIRCLWFLSDCLRAVFMLVSTYT